MGFLNVVVLAGAAVLLLLPSMARSEIGSQDGQRQKPLPRLGASSSSSSSSPFTDDLTGYVNEVMDEWKVPGLAIAVIDGGHTYTEVCMHVRYRCDGVQRLMD